MGLNNAQQQQFVGEIIDANDGVITVDVKNRFAVGDTLELMLPSGNTRFKLQTLSNKHGKNIDAAPGSGHQVRIPLDRAVPESALKFGLLVKDIHA
jgi:putative protease